MLNISKTQWIFVIICFFFGLVIVVQVFFADLQVWRQTRTRARIVSKFDQAQYTPKWTGSYWYQDGRDESATGNLIGRDSAASLSEHDRRIAIGCAVTSRGTAYTMDTIGQRFSMFTLLVPSFCRTASPGFQYHFYVSYDYNDPFFSKEDARAKYRDVLFSVTNSMCAKTFTVKLHFVQCNHKGRPAWAQNDAMMAAYLDNMTYFYRINDDTILSTARWTEAFISTLRSYDPPNVGVVGPLHVGGNMDILTYDFTHRTHQDIFGFYYPRVFTDWFGDDWITNVYKPGRSTKLKNIILQHTMSSGRRYHLIAGKGEKLAGQVKKDQQTLLKYINAVETKSFLKITEKNVIAISLYGSNIMHTYGAIRNAQIFRIFFPIWELWFYVEKVGSNGKTRYPSVPPKIQQKLQFLGAKFVHVDTDKLPFPPSVWSLLVASDPTVDNFIIRRADTRLSARDAALVADWEKSGSSYHCIRDHPSHAWLAVPETLWGGKPYSLPLSFGGRTFKVVIRQYFRKHSQSNATAFLNNVIWPKTKSKTYCHDSVSCHRWKRSHPVPILRVGAEFVGQKFDAFNDNIDSYPIGEIPSDDIKDCTPPSPMV